MITSHTPKEGEFEETKNTLETEETKETTMEAETPAVEVVDAEGTVEAKADDVAADLNPSDVEVPAEAPSDTNPDTENTTEVVAP